MQIFFLVLPSISTTVEKEFRKKSIKITIGEKFVKVCLHSGKEVQISLQFDEILVKKAKL